MRRSIRSLVRKDLAEVEQQLAKLEGVPIVAADAKGGDAAEIEARAQRDVLIARENWLAARARALRRSARRDAASVRRVRPHPAAARRRDPADDGADSRDQ